MYQVEQGKRSVQNALKEAIVQNAQKEKAVQLVVEVTKNVIKNN